MIAVDKVLAIAGVNLRLMTRDRTNVFYMVLMPFVMIFMLGLLFGGGRQLALGVAGGEQGPLSARLTAAMAGLGRVTVVPMDDAAALREAVARGEVDGGLLVPAGYETAVGGGGRATVDYLARAADTGALDLAALVRSAVREEAAPLRAAALGTALGAGPFGRNLAEADRAVAALPAVEVRVTTTGRAVFPQEIGAFSVPAPSMLLLYVFLTSLTAAVGLVATRRSGLARRMYATPTPAATLVAGEAAARLAVALAQGLLVMVGSALLFGVGWGDPLAAAALLVVFAAVGGGAAMLLGSLAPTEETATSVAVVAGMGLGAIGGTMVPLESFSETMRAVANITPHAWGQQAFAELVRHGGGSATSRWNWWCFPVTPRCWSRWESALCAGLWYGPEVFRTPLLG